MSTTSCGYQLRKVSGPEIEPVTLAEVRAQLKIDPDITGDDELLRDTYIPAAREAVEDYCAITLCETYYVLSLETFPVGRLVLPKGPVIQVVAVSYLANDGTRTDAEWDDSGGLDDEPPWLAAPFGTCWPSGRITGGAVQIEYRAGYAGAGSPADSSRVPKRAKQTILAICSRWHEKREMVNVDDLLEAGVFQLRVLV